MDEYKPSMRVCLHHFYIEDYLPFEEIGVLKFILRRDGLTRASSDRLGRNSGNRKAPPRPIAPPAQFSNDFFFFNSKVKTRTVESFLCLFPGEKKNTKSATPIATPSKKRRILSPGPKIGAVKPFYEGFIGTTDRLIELIKSVDEHRSSCNGKVIIRRRFVKTKGLCAVVQCKCAFKSNCTGFWKEGFEWKSASEMKIRGSNGITKTYFVPDVKQALAIATTAPLPTHIDQVLRTIGLFPRTIKYLSKS